MSLRLRVLSIADPPWIIRVHYRTCYFCEAQKKVTLVWVAFRSLFGGSSEQVGWCSTASDFPDDDPDEPEPTREDHQERIQQEAEQTVLVLHLVPPGG